ncbi:MULTISPECIES: EAL domain-containing protein [unclassified Leclercia]|uniref:Sensor domain-containing phosphodiesterase n=1 Tax=Leclercia barmai TaxID=2785629 RepID=A0ABS7RPU9_9ENTR|nr:MULTISPECIES: EAL domain-containing protein [unclassified Leclercia]MBZ0056368.1 sensor domain-containing phosphodiesterase [Leclercia sp. EMC7]MCM5694332.1 sensor domain-containing phosphodiesterase [Leclercia sp. LTM01]MCM5699282.1 sensor domain-containing phosphodiesterase [Leclercia sp. LTM14]
MNTKININLKSFTLALALCLVFVPFSRLISPKSVIDGFEVYLAWMPLSVMLAIILLFGRQAIIPIVISFAIINQWNLQLSPEQDVILLFCQVFSTLLVCGILRWLLGSRWRYQIPSRFLGARIFWLGFALPLAIKLSMFLAGYFCDFPVTLANFSDRGSVIYHIVDIQSLICAVLIFTMLFYYPLRMIINPNYARAFWRRNINNSFSFRNQIFTSVLLLLLAAFLLLLCLPFTSDIIAGYLVPVIFILFTLGVSRFRYPFISLGWALSTLLLLTYNSNFLQGVQNGYSLAFVLSVLISFAICLVYMSRIFQRSEWLKRGWQERALIDPLTGLRNLRALECFLSDNREVTLCCLRMDNLEFLSRHYGLMMRVQCKRAIIRQLQPLLMANEQVFQIPGNELVVVLSGPETGARLQHIIDYMNSRKIYWNNIGLDIEFGGAWGGVESNGGESLYHTLGQLSWLAEKACSANQVLSLNNSLETVSGQTTERVLMLSRIKRALDEGGLRLYAQPIQQADGAGYHEILSRLESEGELLTPDKFLPLVAQFNLSRRFDIGVVESLLAWLQEHPSDDCCARFSVNLMPLTLMQKEVAAEIITLFERYGVRPQSVIIEVTEEQAFSNSEVSIANIQQLRQYGFKIAIDDFGTGYANYERLKRLEADVIKIDGCFVKDICSDSMDAMIVKSICNLAKTRSLCVVAEFVETEEQREKLLASGVDYLQGYLVGKPQPLQ